MLVNTSFKMCLSPPLQSNQVINFSSVYRILHARDMPDTPKEHSSTILNIVTKSRVNQPKLGIRYLGLKLTFFPLSIYTYHLLIQNKTLVSQRAVMTSCKDSLELLYNSGNLRNTLLHAIIYTLGGVRSANLYNISCVGKGSSTYYKNNKIETLRTC